MPRKKNATKKAIWKDFSLADQFLTFSRGDTYATRRESFDLAANLFLLCNWRDKIPESPEDFMTRICTKYDGEGVIIIAAKLLNLVFDCYTAKNSKRIHDLAEAISYYCNPIKGPVDPDRAWLVGFLWGMRILSADPPRVPKRKRKTFSQIRAAYHKKFQNPKDDSVLRRMVLESGYTCLPEKRGPKGPRMKK